MSTVSRPVTPRMIAAVAAIALAGVIHPAVVRADSIERGFVVKIEDREIYLNLNRTDGLSPGDPLRIKRPVRLKHPVTRKTVSDWLPIGTATLTAVGDSLTMARLDPELLAQVAVGDIVEVLVLGSEPLPTPIRAPEPEPEPDTTPLPPLPTVPPETQAVLAVWQRAVGASVEVRLAAWNEFLAGAPDSPHAEEVREHMVALRVLRDELSPPELARDRTAVVQLEHDPPSRARPGEAIPLVFLLDDLTYSSRDGTDQSTIAAAWVHYRLRGSSSYRKAPLRAEGSEYLRGEIPGLAVAGPGVEYFVEVATVAGEVGAAVAAPDRPVRVEVPEPALRTAFRETRSRSRITTTSTFLDFATFDDRSGDRTDAFLLVEADFLYRLRRGLYGVRVGFGVINGSGGFAEQVYDDSNPAPRAGFNYGYTEFEWRGQYNTALAARLVAGVGRDGFGLGVEGRFRLGPEDGTNLSLGAAEVDQVGFLTEIRMQWNAVDSIPLGLAVALTDQPNEGDLGVRLTTDVGYRALSWVQPTLRISYQARTVVHSGIGAGLGLVFDW